MSLATAPSSHETASVVVPEDATAPGSVPGPQTQAEITQFLTYLSNGRHGAYLQNLCARQDEGGQRRYREMTRARGILLIDAPSSESNEPLTIIQSKAVLALQQVVGGWELKLHDCPH